MTRHYYRKPHRIRRKKSIFKNRFFWLTLLILAFAFSLCYFAVFSSFFEIKNIEISGNEKTPKSAIENVIENYAWTDFKFFKKKNLLLVNLPKIDKILLEGFPLIASVSSRKNLPGGLTFRIQERKPEAIFQQNDNWFFIDKEGIIFERTNEQTASSGEFAIIKNSLLSADLKPGERMTEKETMTRIADLLSKMKDDLKIPLKGLTIVSQERLNAQTIEGWEAYFNLKGDLDWQYTKLKTVLEKRIPPEKRGNLIYIDLRFERIYIYPDTYNE
jgi:hypothetical protein